MSKPLKDWTLNEIKEECRSHLKGQACFECDLCSEKDFKKYGSRCKIDAIMGTFIEIPPCSWDFTN